MAAALGGAGRAWWHGDGERFVFVVKTLLAGFVALWLAYRLGLGAPQTALTTVFLLALRSSGMVLEKSAYRLGGTLAGSAAAVFLCTVLAQQPPLLFVALALWVGLCTSGAAMFRNQQSYSCVLAGYTAVIILVPAIAAPEDVFALAVTRVTEVGLGILCSAFVNDAILPRHQGANVQNMADGCYARLLRFCHDVLETRLSAADIELGHLRFAADVALLESGRAAAWFETGHGRAHTRAMRAFNAACMETLTTFYGLHRLIERLRRHDQEHERGDMLALLAPLYRHVAATVRDTPDGAWLAEGLRQLRSDLTELRRHSVRLAPALRLELDAAAEALGRFMLNVGNLQAAHAALREPTVAAPAPQRYAASTPPWILVANGARAAAALLVLGALWYESAWPSAPSALLMASIFCGLSSSSPRPTVAVRQILIGFVIAWPLALMTVFGPVLRADSFATLVLALLPLTALSAWLIGDPRRSAIGVGMGLFATQVIVPLDQGGADPAQYLNNSLALVVGVGLACLMFALILPGYTMGQKDHVATALRRQAALACTARLGGLRHRFASRMRDLLNQLNGAAGPAPDAAHLAVVRQALTLLELGQAVIDLRNLIAIARTGQTRAFLQYTVERMADYLARPTAARHARALQSLSEAGPVLRNARRRAARAGEHERALRLDAALTDVHAMYTAVLEHRQ